MIRPVRSFDRLRMVSKVEPPASACQSGGSVRRFCGGQGRTEPFLPNVRHAMAIVRIADVEKQLLRRSALKIFTSREHSYCASRPKKAEHYAARLAAKKAVLKILPKILKGNYADIEIVRQSSGIPGLRFSKAILKKHPFLKKTEVHISLSHDRKWAGAAALFYYEKPKRNE